MSDAYKDYWRCACGTTNLADIDAMPTRLKVIDGVSHRTENGGGCNSVAPVEPPVLNAVVNLVNEQAEDEALWFEAQTMPEAYLQQELRRLHAVIENRSVVAGELTPCPTNHTCMDNYDENGDITTILWSDESIDYAFCPDCGTSLSPPVGGNE